MWLEETFAGRTKHAAIAPEVYRRAILLQATLEPILYAAEHALDAGLELTTDCVIVVDPNANALGIRLIEEAEADPVLVAHIKAEAERHEATPYFNTARISQVAPLLKDLKIEVDGRAKDSDILSAVPERTLRVVVCTENGATAFNRGVDVVAPAVGQA
jgi:hypothetical protein